MSVNHYPREWHVSEWQAELEWAVRRQGGVLVLSVVEDVLSGWFTVEHGETDDCRMTSLAVSPCPVYDRVVAFLELACCDMTRLR